MQSYRPDVDGLRAVAVLAVVLYHLGVPGFSGGYVGVDVFFVISGYLISGLIVRDLKQGTFSFGDFYTRRVRRIAPALLVTLTITGVFALLMFAPVHLEAFGASLTAAIMSVSNVLFWTESGYFDAAADVKPLLHTWSLGIEEQFYLLWPAALVLLSRGPRWLAPAVAVALVLVGCLVAEMWLRSDPEAAFYLLPARLGELATGAVLVWLPRDIGPTVFRKLGFFAGMAAIAYAVATFQDRTPFPGISAMVPCLATALVIVCRPDGWAAGLLENPLAVQVGRMSYSIYLVHWPVIAFWHYYRYSPLSAGDLVGAALVTGLLSIGLFYLVERPFRLKQAGNWIVPGRVLLASTCSAGVFLLGLGAVYLTTQGHLLVAREAYNPLELALADFQAHGPWLVDAAEADVLLLGDSHADHYTEAVVAAADAVGLAVTRSILPDCPPLLDVPNFVDEVDLTPDQSKCLRRMEGWIDEVRQFNGEFVVLGARWSKLTEPSHYGRYRVRRHWLLIDPDDPNDLFGPRERFKSSVESTVNIILNAGKKAVILGQMPETGADLNSCYAAPAVLLPEASQRCVSVPSEAMMERLEFSEGVFSRMAEQYRGTVEVFLASAAICPHGTCQLDRRGILLYHNEDHITKAASLLLTTELQSQIASFSRSSALAWAD